MAVELQLRLALPTVLITDPISVKRSPFDLNRSSTCPDDESDASTGFHGSTISTRTGIRSAITNKKMKKRSSENSSDSDCDSTNTPPRTLPLLLWNKQPKDDDDLPNLNRTCKLNVIKNEEETEGIVGWPPIKSYWKKQRGQDPAAARNGRGRGAARGVCLYHHVKVQIEGVLITRKIDLNLHQSFQTLTSAILFMFGRGRLVSTPLRSTVNYSGRESVYDYSLTFQDREGDWLPAADMTWRAFIDSAQRLKLVRKED